MKNKLSIIFFCLFVWLFITPKETYATKIPDVAGRLVNSATNAPIAGVYVVWRSSGITGWTADEKGECISLPAGNRYALTNSQGEFLFRAADIDGNQILMPELGRMIDTNFDGTLDAEELPRLPEPDYGCRDKWRGIHYSYDFSCASGPHVFTGVLPTGWSGGFSQMSGWVVNNGPNFMDIGTIYYTGSSTPLPGGSTTVDFGIYPGKNYITGRVFNDTNKNRLRDSSELPFDGPITISTNPPVTVTNFNGIYLIPDLDAGTYTITLGNIPTGFQMIYPRNGPPPFFSVQVGPSCLVDATTGATCSSSGSIDNLNFSMTDSFPWLQSAGLDARFDRGYNNPIASNPTCSGSYGMVGSATAAEGILFIGDSLPAYGYGSVSSKRQIVGGPAYPELFPTTGGNLSSAYTNLTRTIRTSGVPIADITTLPQCNNRANCSLPNNLQARNESVYIANGNLVLNAYDFPNNHNYIFLINGNLTINGPLNVPTGSSVIFSASQDIIVNNTVGSTTPSCSPNNGIEGYFSADRNVIIQGNNNCVVGADRMLKIEGTIIVNAALVGGTFQNNRDLCGSNPEYPTVLFEARPDFILNAPAAIRRKNLIYREIAP